MRVFRATPQNYIVCPVSAMARRVQRGFGDGSAIRGRHALDTGSTVEHQLTGREIGGISVACFPPKRAVLEPRRRTHGTP